MLLKWLLTRSGLVIVDVIHRLYYETDLNTLRMKVTNHKILWLDCLGGIVVGIVVLAICQRLSNWEGLPLTIIVALGLVNLSYGTYSLYVTTRRPRPMNLVKILAVANMAWLVVCIAIASTYWNQITGLGLLHLLGEGAYVAGLGYTEWKMREMLVVL